MKIKQIVLANKFLLLGVLCFVFVASFSLTKASADSLDKSKGGRLVTIYDRSDVRVVLTHAQTVADALQAADVHVVKNDTVEPALDTQLVASDYSINIYRARPVLVIDGQFRQKINTSKQSARSVAKAAGLELHDEDIAVLSQSGDMVTDGTAEVLDIKRATEFELNLYGKTFTAYTQAKNVWDMLKQKGVKLGANDTVSQPLDAKLTTGMQVAVWRNGVQTTTVDEDIDYGVRQVKDYDRPLGYKKVETAGEKGKRTVTYEIVMKNGIEVSRKPIQNIVTTEPKEQVEITGMAPPAGTHTDWMAQAGIAVSDFGYVTYIVDHENRSWHPCRAQGAGMIINCDYAGSLGYGLVQATPGSKMASAGADWRTNPVTQLKWANSYAVGRYGSWQAAYEFKVEKGWW